MLDRLSSDLDRAERSGKASLTHKSVVSNVNHIKIQETSQESPFNDGFIKDNVEPGVDKEKNTVEDENQDELADEQNNDKKMEGDMEEPKP